ncbi:MAG: hypothetical protein IPL46_23620 [Saprospiraceae bacterium]|nr:hypothetical protein [Saprospiraceae bacterium]
MDFALVLPHKRRWKYGDYGNTFYNVRDNEFEPESWAGTCTTIKIPITNVHKLFSIDDVQGGYVYIYGNTYTQSDDSWTNYQVSGIYTKMVRSHFLLRL